MARRKSRSNKEQLPYALAIVSREFVGPLVNDAHLILCCLDNDDDGCSPSEETPNGSQSIEASGIFVSPINTSRQTSLATDHSIKAELVSLAVPPTTWEKSVSIGSRLASIFSKSTSIEQDCDLATCFKRRVARNQDIIMEIVLKLMTLDRLHLEEMFEGSQKATQNLHNPLQILRSLYNQTHSE